MRKTELNSNTWFLMNKEQAWLISFAAVFAISACAPDKKSPRTARVRPGQKTTVVDPKKAKDAPETQGRKAPAAAPASDAATTRGAQGNPSTAAGSGSITPATTELCRITDSSALSAEQLKQQPCFALKVDTNSDGDLDLSKVQKHSLESLAALTFTHGDSTSTQLADLKKLKKVAYLGTFRLSDDQTAVELSFESKKVAAANTKDILFLGYELPQSFDIIDTNSIEVKLGKDAQSLTLVPKDKITILKTDLLTEDRSVVTVHIKDTDLIKNINYVIRINYKLKAANATPASSVAAPAASGVAAPVAGPAASASGAAPAPTAAAPVAASSAQGAI